MTCDSCGRSLPSDARFCPACGTAVADRADGSGPVDGTGQTDGTEQADDGQAAGPDEQNTAAAEWESPDPQPTSRRVLTLLGNLLAVLAGGAVGVLAGLLIVRGW